MPILENLGRWRVLGLLLAIFVGGCAGVPTAQLQAYTNAYDEAKSAAALIYADAAPALLQGGLKAGPFPASLGPATFDRDGCGAAVAAIDELRARCQAMVAVKAYNQALLDVAAGKTSDDILAQVDQAFRSVSTLASVISGTAVTAALGPAAAIFPALRGILGEALKLRDRAALRNALLQAAPHIRIMIQSLRDDVDRLYIVHRAYAATQKLDPIQSAIDENVNAAFSIVFNSAPPTDPAVATSLALMERRFDEMFNAPEPSTRFRLKGIERKGSKPLDGVAIAAIDARLSAAAARIAEFKAAAAQFNKSVDALTRYDNLLAAVDRSFTELQTVSSQPFAVGGGTDQLVQSIVTIRDHAREIRQLLAAR